MTVGMDLGTTNSLVAVLDNGIARVLPNEQGETLVPSAIAAASDGTLVIGRAARDRLAQAPESGRAFFKRDIGTDARYSFGDRLWSPTECSAWILAELKRIAELHLGGPVKEAVITVPAYFRDAQRQATIDAATIAGLSVARIINEPTAAALAYGYANQDYEKTLLVFDLGGGTFDVTLVNVFDGVVEVAAAAGDSRLGGEDYTDALVDVLVARAGIPRDPKRIGRFRQQIEGLKRRLSVREVAAVVLDGHEMVVSRNDLTLAGGELTQRMRPLIQRCLRDGNVTPGEVDDVLLVGGASRMAVVNTCLSEVMGVSGRSETDPDRVVALGAAVQAALCDDDRAVEDLVLTDVCPHTLGIEITKAFGRDHHEDGYFMPMIERNTTLPTSRIEPIKTLHPDQDVIEVVIYQGEARRISENQRLGVVSVSGLRTLPGQPNPGEATVRFSHDMNGVLEVEVTVLHSGEVRRSIIQQRPGELSQDDIDQAMRRLRPLKVLPRDRVQHRARIERAHRLFKELSGDARESVSRGLDQFEAALASQNEALIEDVARQFDEFLERFLREEGEDQGWLDSEDSL